MLRFVVVKTWRLEERLCLPFYLGGLVVKAEKGSYGEYIWPFLLRQLSAKHPLACCKQTQL